MKRCLLLAVVSVVLPLLASAKFQWGDQGDGTYINPVLAADYSDPDVIRVGDKYYMTCSEFHFMGMPILESDDLLHWRVIARVHDSMPGYDEVSRYAEGTWAPALRYHDGRFYIYVCSPHDGLWVTTADDPHGPWSDMHLMHPADRWEDPCPFWDAEGNAYLVRSQYGAGPIIVHRMSDDGMTLLDEGVTVYEGPVAEGPKVYSRDGYVYISIPEGGVHGGWQSMLRGESIYGPFEHRVLLEQDSTDINGPHQGAIVDTPDGEWWFFHFQETPVLGRVVHMQPMRWVDGFPVIGYDFDGNGVGEPMRVAACPSKCSTNPDKPQCSDTFDSDTLSVFWQYNHNPHKECFDLTTRRGWLVWKALPADSLRNAPNTLTQKMMGYAGTVTAHFDASGMAPGQRAGLISMGKWFWGAGVMAEDASLKVYVEHSGDIECSETLPEGVGEVWLRYTYDVDDNEHHFSWSLDGEHFYQLCKPFSQRWGNWKGVRIGLYNYTTATEGDVAVDDFVVDIIR